MGFLDSLLWGGERKVRKLSLRELEGWLLEMQKDEAEEVINKTAPIIAETKKLVEDIRTSVKHLDSLPMPEDMFERAEKIIRTSKPDYVKAMLEELGKFDFSKAKTIAGLRDFSARFEASANALGKIDATKGRYLSFVFEDQHKGIQRNGKKLMESQKRLKEILDSNNRIGGISSAIQEYGRLREIQARSETLAEEKKSTKVTLDEALREFEKAKSRREDEAARSEYAELGEISRKLENARVRQGRIEDTIFQNLSPIKKDLLKYRRQIFDADGGRERLIDELAGNPVQTFLCRDIPALLQILKDFRTAVEEEKVAVKDKSKVIAKTDKALMELNEGARREHEGLTAEISMLGREVERIRALDKRQNLDREIKGLEGKVGELRGKISETDLRIRESEKQETDALESLSRMLDGLTDGEVKLGERS